MASYSSTADVQSLAASAWGWAKWGGGGTASLASGSVSAGLFLNGTFGMALPPFGFMTLVCAFSYFCDVSAPDIILALIENGDTLSVLIRRRVSGGMSAGRTIAIIIWMFAFPTTCVAQGMWSMSSKNNAPARS